MHGCCLLKGKMSTLSEINSRTVELRDAFSAIGAKEDKLDAKEGRVEAEKRKVEAEIKQLEQQPQASSGQERLSALQQQLADLQAERRLVQQQLADLQAERRLVQQQLTELQGERKALQEQRTLVQQKEVLLLQQQIGAAGVHCSWRPIFEPCTVMLLCAVRHCAFILQSFLVQTLPCPARVCLHAMIMAPRLAPVWSPTRSSSRDYSNSSSR
jgi:predicted nuclease with TOPRIM domain